MPPSTAPVVGASVAKIAVVGILGGLLSGFFGVGGGIVMVPLFTLWLGLEQRQAIATSLLAIIPIAIAGLLGYAFGAAVDWSAGFLVGLGGMVGGQLGVWLLPRVPVRALQAIFALLLLYSSYRLIAPTFQSASDPAVGSGDAGWQLLLIVGVAAGALAGLLGVGGGVIVVPALVILASLDITVARGTSLLVVLMTSITASTTNIFKGRTALRIGALAGLIGVPGAAAGSLLGQWVPQEQAAILFALLMIYAAIRMGWRALRRASARESAEPAETA